MTATRTSPLTREEVERYHRDGYLFPVRVLDEARVAELRDAVEEYVTGRARTSTYELTDPIRIKRVSGPGGEVRLEYDGDQENRPHTFGFLFNLWKSDERFANVARDPVIAGMARQLLAAPQILLMEDNVVVKTPHTKALPWHQDYAYWPVAEPAAITAWIALDRITAANGAMEVVPGSHRFGERLPVSFGDARAFLEDRRPGIGAVPQDPAALGHEVITYELEPGECGFHSAMVWHGSTPNTSSAMRSAFIVRYLASGTVWLGAARFPYDDVGCAIGEPIGPAHFPAVATAF